MRSSRSSNVSGDVMVVGVLRMMVMLDHGGDKEAEQGADASMRHEHRMRMRNMMLRVIMMIVTAGKHEEAGA